MAVNRRSDSGVAGDSLYSHLNTTGDSQGEISQYTGIEFVYGLSEGVSDRLIKILQDFFTIYPLGKAFNAALSKVNKEVIVMDEYASDTQLLPQIIVNSMPADNLVLSLGNRLGEEVYEENLYQVFGGNVDINSSITLYESGKPNVGKLADVVFLALMQYIPENLRRTMMTLTPQVRFTNASKLTGNTTGGEIYTTKVSIHIVSEWRQYCAIEAVELDTLRTEPTGADTSLR